MELDHIFICTQKDAPEAELLKAFGLLEGSRNVHLGQGTANRRFFFHNTMLELLWLDNPKDAQSELTRPTGLFERCSLSDTSTSPFGFCFRPTNSGAKNSSDAETKATFPAWDYRPSFFPKSLAAEVGLAPLTEPMWFFLSFASRPSNRKDIKDSKEPLNHEIGFKELTAVVIQGMHSEELSLPAECVNSVDGFAIKQGDTHLIELEFDGGGARKSHDFRPALPLVLRW